MRRRELLAAAGTAATVGLAGCLGACEGAPDEPRRVEATVSRERRVTLAYDGCPTLRDPAQHYTTVENRRDGAVDAGVDVALRDGGALFRGRFRLAPDASVVIERPEPADYAVTVRVPSLGWSKRYEAARDSYDCNEHWQQVIVADGVEARELATTMGCDSLL